MEVPTFSGTSAVIRLNELLMLHFEDSLVFQEPLCTFVISDF